MNIQKKWNKDISLKLIYYLFSILLIIYRFLSHLSLSTEFIFVEIEMKNYLKEPYLTDYTKTVKQKLFN